MNRSKARGFISAINVVPYVDVSFVDPVNAAFDDPLILSVDREGIALNKRAAS